MMKDISLLILNLAYGYLLALYVSFAFLLRNVHADVAALLSLTAIVFIVITHVAVWRKNRTTISGRGFLIFTLLWVVYLLIFLTDEALRFLFGESPFVLVEIDLFLLLILFLICSLSFLFKNPYWYAKSDSKITTVVGISGLIFFAFLIVIHGVHLAQHTGFMIEAEGVRSFLKHVEKETVK